MRALYEGGRGLCYGTTTVWCQLDAAGVMHHCAMHHSICILSLPATVWLQTTWAHAWLENASSV